VDKKKNAFVSVTGFVKQNLLAFAFLLGSLLISLSQILRPPSDYHRYKLLEDDKVFDTQTGLSITVLEGETFENAIKRIDEDKTQFERQRAIEKAKQEAYENAKSDAQRKAEQIAKDNAELESKQTTLYKYRTALAIIRLFEAKINSAADVHQQAALTEFVAVLRRESSLDPHVVSKLESDVGPERLAMLDDRIEKNLRMQEHAIDQEIESAAKIKKREALEAEFREKYEAKRQELGLKILDHLDKLP